MQKHAHESKHTCTVANAIFAEPCDDEHAMEHACNEATPKAVAKAVLVAQHRMNTEIIMQMCNLLIQPRHLLRRRAGFGTISSWRVLMATL